MICSVNNCSDGEIMWEFLRFVVTWIVGITLIVGLIAVTIAMITVFILVVVYIVNYVIDKMRERKIRRFK